MKQLAKGVLNTVLVGVILLALFIFLSPRVLGLDLFTVLSGSMRPAIGVGSVVVVKPAPATAIKVGDIITYTCWVPGEPPLMVTHRVVEVVAGGASFVTKGDANESPDSSEVYPESIVGKVRFAIPLLGYVVHYVRTPLGLMLCLALPGVALIASEVRNIFIQVSRSR